MPKSIAKRGRATPRLCVLALGTIYLEILPAVVAKIGYNM
ncbi:putative membrane protein [Anaplasma phagocytophilum str. ApMUC09]|uniref:Putative membrane protein n=1 Tax=Anaplasma phagocytophilum str. ApMUC09 TaxID=1359152 RepID=A0A0F3ND28_ANAPH|nr:putative membrane protein [Anaplasma phagocytophilum str. ApMUC09]